MTIYNVTIKVEWSIHDSWVKWMLEEHMPEVKATGCFDRYQLLRLVEIDENEGPTYAAQYVAPDKEAYTSYVTNYAAILRQKSFDKWGNKFIAFRTVMEAVN